jgi:hypothetical protein
MTTVIKEVISFSAKGGITLVFDCVEKKFSSCVAFGGSR